MINFPSSRAQVHCAAWFKRRRRSSPCRGYGRGRWSRIDRGMFRLSRGRTTLSAWISGLPIIMLTTTGARSGQARTLPVALPEDDHLVLIASNFGLPSNPGWYYNLRAHPYVMITWKGSSIEMRARELSGAERQRYVDLGLKAYPWWEQYHPRAAPREIPVIMLEPSSPVTG